MTEVRPDDELWQRVQATLDRRADPREDEQVQRLMAADDAPSDDVRRLLERLRLLEQQAPRRSPRTLFVAGLAAALVLAVLTLSPWRKGPDADPLQLESAGPATSMTLELAALRSSPQDVRGERIVLAPRRVFTWTLEGDQP